MVGAVAVAATDPRFGHNFAINACACCAIYVFVLFVKTQYAIQLQLLGGIWIAQLKAAAKHQG